MKQYSNGMKATEFTSKQIGVIYSLAKQGKLSVEKWYMSELYNLSDFYDYDFNKTVEWEERWILNILNNVFSGNLEEAQNLIDERTESYFSLLSIKNQNKCNRSYV